MKLWSNFKFYYKHGETSIEEHTVLETVCGNEAVCCMHVFKCVADSERDVRTLKVIKKVGSHQMLEIRNSFKSSRSVGQRSLNDLKSDGRSAAH
jgi:hypothetical protein